MSLKRFSSAKTCFVISSATLVFAKGRDSHLTFNIRLVAMKKTSICISIRSRLLHFITMRRSTSYTSSARRKELNTLDFTITSIPIKALF